MTFISMLDKHLDFILQLTYKVSPSAMKHFALSTKISRVSVENITTYSAYQPTCSFTIGI